MLCKSDREDRYLRKRHKRVAKRWKKLKPMVKCCPDCFETRVGLNDSIMHRRKRFYLECENCHWCGKSMPTIRLAVRSWNKQKPCSAHLYDDLRVGMQQAIDIAKQERRNDS